MVDVVGAEETEVVVEVVSVEVAGVATQVSVVVAGVAIRATAVVEVGIPEEVLEEVVETLEVGEASTAVVDEGAVGVADPENKEGTRFLLFIFFTSSHPELSVFLQNVPATLDARVTDKSQDDLVNRLKQLTVKPTDLPPRPDFGTIGPSFKLRTNFFPIKLPKKTIYEYDIAITPGTTIRRIKRRIFELAEASNDWTQHGLKGKVAHDFSSKLVAVSKLPEPLVIKIIFKDEDEDARDVKDAKDKKKQKPKEYTLTFKFVKDLDTSNLLEYVQIHFPISLSYQRNRSSLHFQVSLPDRIKPTRSCQSSLLSIWSSLRFRIVLLDRV